MLNAYFGIFTNLIRLSIISYNRGVGEREVDSLIPFLDLCKTFIIRKVAVNCNKRFIEIETLIISVCCCRIIWWRVTIHCFPSAVSKRDVKTGTSLLHLRLNFQKKKCFSIILTFSTLSPIKTHIITKVSCFCVIMYPFSIW